MPCICLHVVKLQLLQLPPCKLATPTPRARASPVSRLPRGRRRPQRNATQLALASPSTTDPPPSLSPARTSRSCSRRLEHRRPFDRESLDQEAQGSEALPLSRRGHEGEACPSRPARAPMNAQREYADPRVGLQQGQPPQQRQQQQQQQDYGATQLYGGPARPGQADARAEGDRPQGGAQVNRQPKNKGVYENFHKTIVEFNRIRNTPMREAPVIEGRPVILYTLYGYVLKVGPGP